MSWKYHVRVYEISFWVYYFSFVRCFEQQTDFRAHSLKQHQSYNEAIMCFYYSSFTSSSGIARLYDHCYWEKHAALSQDNRDTCQQRAVRCKVPRRSIQLTNRFSWTPNVCVTSELNFRCPLFRHIAESSSSVFRVLFYSPEKPTS